MPHSEWFNIITIIIGVISLLGNLSVVYWLGPVSAAKLTRKLQQEGASKDRKMEVFKRLAATRGVRANPDHVWALNLLPIEFNSVPTVMEAWRLYLEHLRFPMPTDDAKQVEFFHERDKRLTTLILAVAEQVGIKLDRMDIQDYSYAPQLWADDEFDTRQVRKLTVDLLAGRKPLQITPVPPPTGTGPFPAPPQQTLPPKS